jgi:hypothetical protein
MITDIYIQHQGEPRYDENLMVENEEMLILLAQLKMTLMTSKESVLGAASFGVDENRMLFDFSESFNKVSLENEIRYQLKEYCTLLKNRNWEVEAYIVPDGTDQYRDAIHVLLTIDSNVRFVIAYE